MNTLAEKYRETEIGKIPSDWEFHLFEEIVDVTRLAGYEYSEYWEETPSGDILALKGENIGINKIINKNFAFISNELSLKLGRSRLNVGDIVFPCVGTIGNAFVVDKDNKYHINQNIAKITPNKEKIDSLFLAHYLMSDLCRVEILRFNATTSQPNVLVGSLRKFRIGIPPLAEQKKIAEILSSWDNAIEVIENLIAKKEDQKKGLMQKLLTGKKRFKEFAKEKWARKTLDEVCEICYGKEQKAVVTPNGIYPIIGTGGVLGMASKYLYDKPSVIIGRKGTIDRPVYVEEPFWTIDTAYYTIFKNGTEAKWFYYWFQTLPIKIYNEASGVPSLSRETLYKIKLSCPNKKEQQKIASVLSQADKEIEQLKTQFNSLLEKKRGLMQVLLTGKKRVKI